MSEQPPPAPFFGRDCFSLGAWFFLRALAIVHLIAFVSYWVQLEGLIGPHGILPASEFLKTVHDQLGAGAYHELPTLCWIGGTGAFLHALCAAGVALAILLFVGVAPALCLLFLWVDYLSLVCVGQIFYEFQWDALLLEATLLAVFLAPWSWLPLWRRYEPPRLARWLLWWLLCRLMFLSGVVKLASGDPTWRNLTALMFHYETQPLPTPPAWYVFQLPAWFHRGCCVLMFFIELVAPFALFAPRRWRHAAALLLIVLQLFIAVTGNYAFFNLLAIALCLLCFDDALFARKFTRFPPALSEQKTAPIAPGWLLRPLAVFVFIFTALLAALNFSPAPLWFDRIASAVAPLRTLNNYGLFAVMTTTRPEIIFEGSDGGRDWTAYSFRYKPGDLRHAPVPVAPYQPRLDWQLWFAALGPPEQNPWVFTLCTHLLRGTPEVLALLGPNPFPKMPPRYVRAVRYEYEFTDSAVRTGTGKWWRRTPLDPYVPPISLQ